MGFTGNKVIQTPHIDKLAAESVWLEDYHVAPSCSPTRGSLMAGRWTNRVGTWHTFFTRAMMHDDEVTIADHFQAANYSTGMFGKWHLGDHYPYRPQDRGFDEVFCLQGGATGVTADYWDNDLVDDHLMHNGKITKTKGYITDVLFDAAESYIKEQVKTDKPFFAYIATNAPHKPWVCPPEYSQKYPNLDQKSAAFNGMVTNIDYNVGELRKTLNHLGVSDNTIFIYTTDNGTVNPDYKGNMRGAKGSAYEGGHHVPFMLHWPAGGFTTHKKITELTHVVDILPTLLELCEVEAQPSHTIDGVSLVELINEEKEKKVDWENRIVISDSQRLQFPEKWKDCSVMKDKWRLINGKELYHIGDDPMQENDIASKHPQVVTELRQWYEKWWSELEPTYNRISEIRLGGEHGSDITLTCLQWMDENPPWNQGIIRRGPKESKAQTNTTVFNGYLAVKVLEAGKYLLSVRRWPKESGLKIREGVEALAPLPGRLPSYSFVEGVALPITAATMRINGKDGETKPVEDDDQAITFNVELKEGSYKLSPYFTQKLKSGKIDKNLGCYYIDIKKI